MKMPTKKLYEEEQPCGAFRIGEEDAYRPGNPMPHVCPACGLLRYFCANCARDHHQYGWNACKPKEESTPCPKK